MNTNCVRVARDPTILNPDQSRVLLRPLMPGDIERVSGIVSRVMVLPEAEVSELIETLTAELSQRHLEVQRRFLDRFFQLQPYIEVPDALSVKRRMLIGAYFLAEYSLESAALFNPSIVVHPDQRGSPPNSLRFVLSLRATGEGHVSSLTFRDGLIHSDHRIEVFSSPGFLTEPNQITNPLNDLESFNYEVQFSPELDLSQRILFPGTPSQRNGIEDARFVQFFDDDGSSCYFATFTAYDGTTITPELVETTDFLGFRFFTLHGSAARNKGMALFPRRIDGRFAMLARQDNENLHIMYSDNIHFWNSSSILVAPVFPWELFQIGNCGSPIETDAGWLVLSHGVGPMRTYCIGAFLLDRENPSKLIGRLREPLIEPSASERKGYVPNVVYSCGSLLHDEHLFIPYGLADHASGFATVPLLDVLSAMEPVA